MSIEPTKNVRVHRFRDYVAYSAKGETEYLTAATARGLARLLNKAAQDIETRGFGDSEFSSTETAQERIKKELRIYDNGGKTVDRYTAVYMREPEHGGLFAALGMSADPFHPQGFGQHCTAKPGRHLGKRVSFDDLPAACQRFVLQNLD